MSTSTLSDTGLGRTDLGGLRIAIANWRDPWHPQAGGAERYAWEMARALAGARAPVTFLTARAPGQAGTEERDGIAFGVHLGRAMASAGRLLEGSAPRWVYRRHAWVAVSPSTVAAMRERLGWTGDIYLIPNGTARPVTATVARAGAKNLVWVGRLVAPKRAGLLVGVAERLRQRPPQERPFLDVLAEGPVLDQLVAAGAAARRQATPMERLTGASQP